MGKLRIEPKEKGMDPERYREIQAILRQARSLVQESHVFYDLEEGEAPTKVRKEFAEVAEKEGITLDIRRIRGKRSLQLVFDHSGTAKAHRLSADEARARILDVLKKAKTAMKKSQIMEQANLNPGSWNARINELIESGAVTRSGERRDTVYSIA